MEYKGKKKKKKPLNRHHIVLKIYIIFKIIVSKYIKMQSLSTKTKTKIKSFFFNTRPFRIFFFFLVEIRAFTVVVLKSLGPVW